MVTSPHPPYTASMRLVALLCNPPTNKPPEETITWKNLTVLAGLFGFANIEIINLVPHPTKSNRYLHPFAGTVGFEALLAKTQLAVAGSTVVAAWGTTPPPGWPRDDWRKLISAAMTGAEAAGVDRLAHVGPKTRHPSRWRQFTSPVHKRFSGTSFEARLAEAVQWSSPSALVAAC